MANEWKRATWTYSPVTLSHNYQHILNAIDAVMLAGGWVRPSWSNGGAIGTDNYYMRPDRLRLDVRHNKYGPSGNQTITVSGAVLSKQNLTGGAFGELASVRASGYVAFTGQPADGDTVTLTDGVVTKTFEFDNNASVTAGNVQVVIGSTVENSIENIALAVAGEGMNLVAAPHWHWWYTGDNYYQHGGIRIRYVAGSPNTIQIAPFLQNVAGTASQVTCDIPVTINYDGAVDVNFLFIAGEDGFYVEGGSSSNYNNIAHGMVFSFYPDESMAGTRDRERTWITQGCSYELRGALRSYDRNVRFVETVGDRRNHTGRIVGRCARGATGVLNRDTADARDLNFGVRDHLIAIGATYNNTSTYFQAGVCTLGMHQSNFDDVYRVSGLVAIQGWTFYDVYRSSTGAETVGAAPGSQPAYLLDVRNAIRDIPRFGVCSSYILPWNNITDKRTGVVYRVAQVSDGGRNSNLCVVWPDNSNVVTIPATP